MGINPARGYQWWTFGSGNEGGSAGLRQIDLIRVPDFPQWHHGNGNFAFESHGLVQLLMREPYNADSLMHLPKDRRDWLEIYGNTFGARKHAPNR
jgi:hypothetical protein